MAKRSGLPGSIATPPPVRDAAGTSLIRTHGTGILIRHGIQNHLMTCRHEYEDIPFGQVLKAFVVGLPPIYMAGARVRFHSQDKTSATADVALVKLGANAANLLDLIPITSSSWLSPVIPDGAQLEVWGYPMCNIMQDGEFAPNLVCTRATAMDVL